METKLTLNIESDLVQMAKSYAKKKGYTLSNLVENYFLLLVKSEGTNKPTITASVANALLGSLRAPDKTDYKEELTNSLTEKYL